MDELEVRRAMEAAFAAFEADDLESVGEAMDPEIEIHAAPDVGNPGDFHGRDGFERWARLWVDAWDEFRQEVVAVEMLSDDVAVVGARQMASGAGSGIALEREVHWALEFRGARTRRLHLYGDRAQAVAAAQGFRAD